jgi:hypothetical protein
MGVVMAKKASLYAALTLVILGALAAGGYWAVGSRSDTICSVCQRPIKPELAVLAEIGGQKKRICCARCAITEAHQQKQSLRILQVTDYVSQRKLDPQQAWFVEDSRKMACSHDMARMDMSKYPQQLAFDRCAPGAFAFARREDADAFVVENGGVVRRLAEMTGEVNPK